MTNETKPVAIRDENGRFLPGTKPGPGRPPAEIEKRYFDLTVNQVTESDWLAIVKRAVIDARDGDRFAREWLGNYILGRPVQRIDADINQKSITIVFDESWRE